MSPKTESVRSNLNVQLVVLALPNEYPGNNLYLSVSNFNPRNTADVRALSEQVKGHGSKLKLPSIVHVLDNLPGFQPPSQDLYGSAEIQDKVVLQVVFLADARLMVSWDLYGLGKSEPI